MTAAGRKRLPLSDLAARLWQVLRGITISGFAVLALTACTTTGQPGSPSVYAEIEAMDTCGDLQRWFDQVMSNAEALEPGDEARDISLAYADATIARMDDLDCG